MTIPAPALQRVSRIITHDNCPDGLASAMILHDVYPDAQIEFVNYNEPSHARLEATPHMLFCDICPPHERLQGFVDAEAIVLDHHGTQKKVVLSFGDRGVFADEHKEPKVSGAVLAYREVWRTHDLLTPYPRKGFTAPWRREKIARFAQLAGIRDLWRTEDPSWKDACIQASALMFFGPERLLGTHPPWLDDGELYVGEILLAKRLTAARQIAEHGLQDPLPGVTPFVFFNDSIRDKLTSDVAEAYRDVVFAQLQAFQSHVVVGYYVSVEGGVGRNDVYYNYSLRSVNPSRGDRLRPHETPVSSYAKKLGGGGHDNAAGCRLRATDKSPVRAFLTALYGEAFPPFED